MTVKNDCKEAKQALRNRNKFIRKEVYSEEKNIAIINNFRALDAYKKAKNILAFYPIDYEINLKELFVKNEDKKHWFLPKMVDDKMFFCAYNDKLVSGKFNIKEPAGKIIQNPDILDLIILPALATDKKGNRLGYGKGCYDTFLGNINAKTILVLPIFSELIVDTVPVNEFDKKVNIVVTDLESIFI